MKVEKKFIVIFSLSDDIREFFCLPMESEESLDVLPKEMKK